MYISRSRVSLLAPYLPSSDTGPSSINLHTQSVRLTMATEDTHKGKSASSARQAKARRRRATDTEKITAWVAALGVQTGMLPWTARLTDALFKKMLPVADFAEAQCASLRCAIV